MEAILSLAWVKTRIIPHQTFIYLERGDIADITSQSVVIYDQSGEKVERQVYELDAKNEIIQYGKYGHKMLKDIYDQPDAILTTLQGRLDDQQVFIDGFGVNASEYFSRIHRVQIVASGTSYNAGLAGRFLLESVSGLPCQVEHASSSNYRERIAEPNTLFVTLSQSGETPETLNALRVANNLGYTATLTISNAPGSSIVSESDLVLITGAGTSKGATTVKDFSAQLTALSLLSLALGRYHRLDAEKEARLAKKLRGVPGIAQKTLQLDGTIKNKASEFKDKQRALYIGNGIKFPVAMEGAMKLKELSSIYTEALLSDEIDTKSIHSKDAKVIALASKDDKYFEGLEKDIQKAQINMLVFADENHEINNDKYADVIGMPAVDELFSPMTYVIPMQLLAYHVAVSKHGNADGLQYEQLTTQEA
jgi:glucosamine--fructose-6-phosphate aminotransferase (isomerizing)